MGGHDLGGWHKWSWVGAGRQSPLEIVVTYVKDGSPISVINVIQGFGATQFETSHRSLVTKSTDANLTHAQLSVQNCGRVELITEVTNR